MIQASSMFNLGENWPTADTADALAEAMHADLTKTYEEDGIEKWVPPAHLILFSRQCGRASLALSMYRHESFLGPTDLVAVPPEHVPQKGKSTASHVMVMDYGLGEIYDPTWGQFLLPSPDALRDIAEERVENTLPSHQSIGIVKLDNKKPSVESVSSDPELQAIYDDIWNPSHMRLFGYLDGTQITFSAARIAKRMRALLHG